MDTYIKLCGNEGNITNRPYLYIVDFRSAVGLPYDHRSVANTDTRFEPKTGSRVFFPWRLVRPSQDGERAERLTNTLFGAIFGGRHRQERLGVDEFALSDTMLRLSYDNIMVLRVNRSSTRQ